MCFLALQRNSALIALLQLSKMCVLSWMSVLSRTCRTASALVGKFYVATGLALHTMSVLQAYQADVLKDLDERAGVTSEAVKELRQASDLALRVIKHTACTIGRSMPGLVAVERHLWLNLAEICDKDKGFLVTVNAVIKMLAKQQSIEFKQLFSTASP